MWSWVYAQSDVRSLSTCLDRSIDKLSMPDAAGVPSLCLSTLERTETMERLSGVGGSDDPLALIGCRPFDLDRRKNGRPARDQAHICSSKAECYYC